MRIILIGQAAFAEKTLEKLAGKGEEVVAVYCPPDPPSGKFDPVKQKAIDLQIPVRQHKSFKAPEVFDEFVALHADLAILAFVTQIVPQQIFSAPSLGSICFHPSLLPKYRGASAINWALINGEAITGLSLFWVDKGIDTGPILLQKEVTVEPNDTTGSLYFNKIFPLGVEAIGEAVDLIKTGNPPRIVQDESKANYDPICGDEHAKIDWAKPAQQVYNLIRGCDPQPGAHTTFTDKRLRLFDARMHLANNSATAGQVTGMGAEEITVALNGGTLTVKKVRGEGAKTNAADFAQQIGLKVGDKLG
ncbi:MAG TPA: methionyl-tRNA formyltransferase [Candidatus Limnocylindria bacterium]|nr:methionyl-tRNA formyltransferase [Candidatus Limnocylindria bacterium]